MRIRNLTPHTVNLFSQLGVLSLSPDGVVARVRTGRWQADDELAIPVIDVIQGAVLDLPDPKEGVYLLVSTYVAQHHKIRGRSDVISSCHHTAIRDLDGEVIATRNFLRYR